MSDGSARPWQDPRFWAEPGADDAREARHQVLADLLAAYVDDELPPETASQLDAHLVGCARCRRDVRLQLAVRGALAPAAPDGEVSLGSQPTAPAASAALRARVAAITAAPPPADARASRASREPSHARPDALRRLVIGAGLVLLAAGGGLVVQRVAAARASQAVVAAPVASVPLLGAALADYRRVVAGDLPGRARDLAAVRGASGLPVEPLRAEGLRLIGAWTTELEGEPSAVLAYRWNDRLLVQYIVPEQLFFSSPATRAAAAEHRRLAVDDRGQGVVAWPMTAAGSVLIGEGGPARVAEAIDP